MKLICVSTLFFLCDIHKTHTDYQGHISWLVQQNFSILWNTVTLVFKLVARKNLSCIWRQNILSNLLHDACLRLLICINVRHHLTIYGGHPAPAHWVLLNYLKGKRGLDPEPSIGRVWTTGLGRAPRCHFRSLQVKLIMELCELAKWAKEWSNSALFNRNFKYIGNYDQAFGIFVNNYGKPNSVLWIWATFAVD